MDLLVAVHLALSNVFRHYLLLILLAAGRDGLRLKQLATLTERREAYVHGHLSFLQDALLVQRCLEEGERTSVRRYVATRKADRWLDFSAHEGVEAGLRTCAQMLRHEGPTEASSALRTELRHNTLLSNANRQLILMAVDFLEKEHVGDWRGARPAQLQDFLTVGDRAFTLLLRSLWKEGLLTNHLEKRLDGIESRYMLKAPARTWLDFAEPGQSRPPKPSGGGAFWHGLVEAACLNR